MKSTEVWLGVCIYGAILLAAFSNDLYPLVNKPLLSEIRAFWHAQLRSNHGSYSLVHPKNIREGVNKG
jgi:hypothetical protein